MSVFERVCWKLAIYDLLERHGMRPATYGLHIFSVNCPPDGFAVLLGLDHVLAKPRTWWQRWLYTIWARVGRRPVIADIHYKEEHNTFINVYGDEHMPAMKAVAEDLSKLLGGREVVVSLSAHTPYWEGFHSDVLGMD